MNPLYYGAALLAALLISCMLLVHKVYQKNFGETVKAGFRFNAAIGAVAIVLFFIIGGFKFEVEPFSVVMAFLNSTTVLLYTVLGFKLMNMGQVAKYSLFLMSGGMTVPYIFGLLFLGEAESFKWFSLVGLVLILAACVLSAGGDKNSDKRAIPLCAGVFLLNGFTSVFSKIHSIAGAETVGNSALCRWVAEFESVSDVAFVMWNGVSKVVFCSLALAAIALFAGKKTDAQPENVSSRSVSKVALIFVLIALIASAIDGAAYFLQLVIAKNVPATLQYPLVTGGSIVFTALLGFAFLHEKPTKKTVMSIIMCFAGILMFVF